ncbi:MAG: hypothetical protein ACFFAN_15915 [Promethearchaeota archaeon]
MKEKTKIILVLMLFIIFLCSSIQIPKTTKNPPYLEQNEQKDTSNDKPLDIEPLEKIENLKTAGNPQQGYNFSFNTLINEELTNMAFGYINYNSTKPNDKTNWMVMPRTKGSNLEFIILIYNLTNTSSMKQIKPSDLNTMYLSYLNESLVRENISQVNDHPWGVGYGYVMDQVKINESNDAQFVIWNDWAEATDIMYNATIWITSATRSRTTETKFIPSKENTQSNTIVWELSYQGYFNYGDYNASLEIAELNNFTIKTVSGYDGKYWTPINYSNDNTHIYINESFMEYKIELLTPNCIDVMYNENLTWVNSENELRLYVMCKMEGNLTIRFEDTNGTVHEEFKEDVAINEIVFFNYIMNLNATGGIGSLNITLVNKSKILFGIKICEVMFYKQTVIGGYTQNTPAFSEFFVAVGFIDLEYSYYLDIYKPYLTDYQKLNQTIIPKATVTFEFEGYMGELNYGLIEVEQGVYINAYSKILDLRELQIAPGKYNITFRANKLGYSSLVNITEIEILKKNATIEIVSYDDILTIEEPFAISVNVYNEYPYENYLWVPVNITLTILKNGEIEDQTTMENIIQSITLRDVMSNDTIPGSYMLNMSIESEYYQGNRSFTIEVIKKNLKLSLDYDDIVEEDEKFEVDWELENGDFNGNRENMTLQILIDGDIYETIDLTTGSSGDISFELDEGDYEITFRLISPFYFAEETIDIEAEEEETPEPTWLEQNWPWILVLIIILIIISIFSITMLYSRHKIKIQRGLESELIALKTKFNTTENQVSLLKKQISQIAGIYWILVVHSEQGTTMVEITDFKFKEVLGDDYNEFIGKDIIIDSALIGGFLTAIRNFSRETSGTLQEYQSIFNSQTDYTTIINDQEVHRRILEGTDYFMGFISTKGTIEISNILSTINSKFRDGYGKAVKTYKGRITIFEPFKNEVISFLHNEIRNLQNKLSETRSVLNYYDSHLNQVQEKIGIKPHKRFGTKSIKKK